MIANPNAYHSRSLDDNGLCPRFATRIPDSTRWFTGALQGHSLLVESPDQIVRRRAGRGRLDFTSGFDANPPTSKRIYGKDRFFQRCSGSPWMGDFRSGAFRTIPPAWVKADKRIWLTWFRRGDLGCSWWMWFELRPRG